MKNNTVFFLLSALILTTFISCNKNNEPLQPKGNVPPVYPKQIIWSSTHGLDSLYTQVISIKYDTLNYQILLYLDDTTNSNPYDRLIASYRYNKDGYLIKVTGILWQYADFIDEPGFEEVAEIKRDPKNQIIYLASGAPYMPTDSFYYFYGNNSQGPRITTIKYDREYPQFNDTAITQLDPDYNILSSTHSRSNSEIYEYNADKSLSKISGIITEQFSYPSLSVGIQKDLLSNLLLGKDHYLTEIRGFYPFRFTGGLMYGNIFGVSATNPYHFYHIAESNEPILRPNAEADLSYELDDQKRLTKATFLYNGELYGSAIFKY